MAQKRDYQIHLVIQTRQKVLQAHCGLVIVPFGWFSAQVIWLSQYERSPHDMLLPAICNRSLDIFTPVSDGTAVCYKPVLAYTSRKQTPI